MSASTLGGRNGAAVYAEDDLYEDEEEDLTGWTVLDETGRTIGTVAAHEDIPGNPCIVLRTELGEALVPLHEELVLEIDEENETLRMVIPEGLLDL